MSCSGCGTSGCCCGSVTVQSTPRVSGIHPEHIRTFYDFLESDPAGLRYQLIIPSSHLLGMTLSAWGSNIGGNPNLHWESGATYDDPAHGSWNQGVTVRLYSVEDPDAEEISDFILGVTLLPGEIFTLGDEYCGLFLDYGLYAEVRGIELNADATFHYLQPGGGTSSAHNAFTRSVGYRDRVQINATYVEREEYTPAYSMPTQTLQHYWNCANDDPFLSTFYSGASNEKWANSGKDTGASGGGTDGPNSVVTTIDNVTLYTISNAPLSLVD